MNPMWLFIILLTFALSLQTGVAEENHYPHHAAIAGGVSAEHTNDLGLSPGYG